MGRDASTPSVPAGACLCGRQPDAACPVCGEAQPAYWCEVCQRVVPDKRCPLCGLKARKLR